MDEQSMDELAPVLTVDEFATFLRLNRKTVYEAIHRGAISGVRRFGRIIRIDRDAAMAWLKAGNDRLTDGKSRFGGRSVGYGRGTPAVLPSGAVQGPASHTPRRNP
jgi:excisionase family DNA binding protein